MRRLAAPVYALALAAAVLAPLSAPGYLLIRDAVTTPRSYLTDAALGIGEAAPRAIPQDFGIALLTTVLDGGTLGKVLLALGLWSAGWGAARLAACVIPTAGMAGQLVAATIAIWNPYVAERLLQGHWSLVVGYGCLPWIAQSVIGLRAHGGTARWCALAFWIALAGLTPTGAVLALFAGLAAVWAAPIGGGAARSRLAAAVGTFTLGTALPWLVASGLGSTVPAGDEAGVHAFAARAEPGLGTLGSLASLGGMWNAQAVPLTRTSHFAMVYSAALLTIVTVGALILWRRRVALPLLSVAAAAIVLPALLATGPGLSFTTWLITTVPGMGILRDGQKWVALAMPAYALAGAAAVTVVRGQPARAVAVGLSCAIIIFTLPDLAWGVGGRVRSVTYPPGWSEVAARINADPHPLTLLPPETMRQYPWGPTGSATEVLDPFPRWVRAETVNSGDLHVGGFEVRGDGVRGRRVERLLLAGAEPRQLADEGIGWVVVEHRTPGDPGLSANTLARLDEVYQDADIALYRVPGPWASIAASAARRNAAIAAHAVWILLLLAGPAAMVLRLRENRTRRQEERR